MPRCHGTRNAAASPSRLRARARQSRPKWPMAPVTAIIPAAVHVNVEISVHVQGRASANRTGAQSDGAEIRRCHGIGERRRPCSGSEPRGRARQARSSSAQLNSTGPFGVRRMATSPPRPACVTAVEIPNSSSERLRRSASGCSILNDSNRHPVGEFCAGWGDPLAHSMKNGRGSTPSPPNGFVAASIRQRSTLPSGLVRNPASGPTTS